MLTCLGELAGRFVVEAALRAHLAVFRLPSGDLHPGIKEVLEPVYPQTLLSEPAVEALDVTILHRSSGLDVTRLDFPLQRPGQKMTTGEFGPIITTDRSRHTTPGDRFIQKAASDSSTGEARIDFQRQAFAREGIHHIEHTDRATGSTFREEPLRTPWLASSASGIALLRDTLGTEAYGSRTRHHEQAAPGADDSHNAPSPAIERPDVVSSLHRSAWTASDNSILPPTIARPPGAR